MIPALQVTPVEQDMPANGLKIKYMLKPSFSAMFLALQTPVDLHTFKVLLGCELVPDLDHLTFETENIHYHFHFQNLAALDCWGLFLLSYWHRVHYSSFFTGQKRQWKMVLLNSATWWH